MTIPFYYSLHPFFLCVCVCVFVDVPKVTMDRASPLTLASQRWPGAERQCEVLPLPSYLRAQPGGGTGPDDRMVELVLHVLSNRDEQKLLKRKQRCRIIMEKIGHFYVNLMKFMTMCICWSCRQKMVSFKTQWATQRSRTLVNIKFVVFVDADPPPRKVF